MLGEIAGRDLRDITTLYDQVPDYFSTEDIRDLRIGIDARWNTEDVDEPVRKMLTVLPFALLTLDAIQNTRRAARVA